MTKLDPVFVDATKSLEVQHETVRTVYIQIAIAVSDCINSVDNEERGKCSNFICLRTCEYIGLLWLGLQFCILKFVFTQCALRN